MEKKYELSEVLEVASEAGHILLENGAEISRVEDIMSRIANHFGVDSGNFFVLSNGIFTTGNSEKVSKAGGQASTYANVEFIPIRGVQLSKVRAVNQLSYDIVGGRCTLEEARERLRSIRAIPPKPVWEQTLATGLGAGGFCAVFGGGYLDCAAALVVGLILGAWMLLVSGRYLSKIVGGISNALIANLLCIILWRIGFAESLSNVIIAAMMPLVPGVPFVNGVRDLANSDYLAGLTRLTDAMLGFFCIAMGVTASFLLDGAVFGGIISLQGVGVNPETEPYLLQALAAFVGTVAFACLYGVDRIQYVSMGIIGALGWMAYLLLARQAGASAPVAALFAAMLVCLMARVVAVPARCPAQLFLICGLFTLVPGAGIFWSTYHLTAGDIDMARSFGFTAVKVAVAIVLGIVFAMELPQRLFSRKNGAH
ncbi:MAG: threonine/serine exporter family protein [Bacteroidales bacterium]|nr:threonine/serine exporter family protein [Bacteroidales bacterium]